MITPVLTMRFLFFSLSSYKLSEAHNKDVFIGEACLGEALLRTLANLIELRRISCRVNKYCHAERVRRWSIESRPRSWDEPRCTESPSCHVVSSA